MEIVFASNNKGKLKEIRAILDDVKIVSLGDLNIDIDVVEDCDTFYGNALKKAREIYEVVGIPVIADDSGLCIEGLDNFPGVLTHRFLGEDATDTDRNNYLISETNKIDNRKASFICEIVYYDGVNTLSSRGILEGVIAKFARGDYGFGFDKILELPNTKTVGELTDEEKNEVSARKEALVKIKEKIRGLK